MDHERKEADRVFAKMEETLASPEKWTQLATARDRFRHVVTATNPDAVCFCLLGALSLASASLTSRYSYPCLLLNEEAKRWGFKSPPAFNDSAATKHGDVLQFIRTARARNAGEEVTVPA